MVLNAKKIKTFLINILLVALCMYVANPFFIASAEQINKIIYYVFCLMSIPLLLRFNQNIKFKRKNFMFIAYIILYYFLVIVISQQGDNTYVEYLTRQFQRLLGMVTVVLIWKRLFERGKTYIRFEMLYIYSIILYLCSTFFFIINPAAKSMWINTIVSYQEEYLLEWNRFSTRFGFAGWSSFDISIWVVIGFIYLYYLYLNKKITFKPFFALSLILVVGSSIYARSGIMISALMVVIITFNELRKKETRYLRYGILGSIILVMLVILLQKYNAAAKESLEWMLEFINGRGHSDSTDELFAMYKNFNPSVKTLLIGDGKWNLADGTYYGKVDVGILRNLLFGGICYTAIEYGLGSYFIFLVYQKCKQFKVIGYKIVPFMMGIIFAFCELKGDLIFYNLRMMIPFLWLISTNKREQYLIKNNGGK